MDASGLTLTILSLVGVALFILLHERKRATRIQRDLKDMAAARRLGPRRSPER